LPLTKASRMFSSSSPLNWRHSIAARLRSQEYMGSRGNGG